MTEPKRIQRRRAGGWQMPTGATYVGRPTRWGNPFAVGALDPDHGIGPHITTPARAVELFRRELLADQVTYWDPGRRRRLFLSPHLVRIELAGRDLACWCPLDQPCHADVLLDIANPEGTRT